MKYQHRQGHWIAVGLNRAGMLLLGGLNPVAAARVVKLLLKVEAGTLVGQYVDEGRSARGDNISKRPKFKQMIAAALAGKFDVVVVHKRDRFSRNLRMMLDCFDRRGILG